MAASVKERSEEYDESGKRVSPDEGFGPARVGIVERLRKWIQFVRPKSIFQVAFAPELVATFKDQVAQCMYPS
eukprot:1637574-Lingulodinium_polyedra.AAC.1